MNLNELTAWCGIPIPLSITAPRGIVCDGWLPDHDLVPCGQVV